MRQRLAVVSLLKRVLIAGLVAAPLLAVPSLAGVNAWSLALPVSAPSQIPGAVAIDRNSAIAYAATADGIFKTVDRGETWTLVDPLPGATAIAIDPRNAATIVAGNHDVRDYRAELRLSEDGGVTWRTVHAFAWESFVGALTFDPFQPGVVYAALSNSGVGKSADGGKTWTISDSRNGLRCCVVDFFHTLDLAVGGRETPTIFAASDGLFRSTDGGQSWQEVIFYYSPALDIRTVSVSPRDPARLYITGYVAYSNVPRALTSGDGGESWQQLPAVMQTRITADPRSPSTLYAANHGGVLRSSDHGATWWAFDRGMPDVTVRSIEVDATGTLLFASTSAGVFKYEVPRPPRRRPIRR